MKTFIVRLEVKEVDDSKLVNGVETVFDHTLLNLDENAASVMIMAYKGLGEIAK